MAGKSLALCKLITPKKNYILLQNLLKEMAFLKLQKLLHCINFFMFKKNSLKTTSNFDRSNLKTKLHRSFFQS